MFQSGHAPTAIGQPPPTGLYPIVNLPLAFKIFCTKSRLTNNEYYIGHEKHQKLHAISTRFKLWNKAIIGLHQGPSVDSPILGSAFLSSTGNTEITLASGRQAWSREAFDLPIEGIPAPEHFEWHRSDGPEVASLNGRGKRGWVLMRVGHGAEMGEPVAAYSLDMTGLKHSGDFAFFNSGQTGQLGPDFAVMAVVTALALGQQKRNNVNNWMWYTVAVT